ncbi:MAG: HPr family phosphocarrier protein [Firmicutes bacterium]|nr:HPr family phosphocarrier protein [Bacillota bacterium]
MAIATAKIIHETGLHARPASVFVRLANTFKSNITVSANGRKANAKSILEILTLGAGKDCELTIEAHGDDEERAVKALVEMVTTEME